MKSIKCPHCRHAHEHDEDDLPGLVGEPYICQGCGRRLRISAEGGSMRCDGCGRSHECDDCIEDVRAEKVCFVPSMHSWQPTLAVDLEKCSNCYDIRRIPVPPAACPS